MSKMSTGELQIAERARNHKGEALHSLHHFIDDALLEESYKQLNKNSSGGPCDNATRLWISFALN
jgi:hypothetical protein